MSELTTFLKTVPLFAQLSDPDLTTLAYNFRLRRYAREDTLFHHGDNSTDIYVVLSGKVRIYKINLSGYETSINIFGRGDIIGELAAIDNQPRSATAKALEHCQVLELRAELFCQFMQSMPGLALGMVHLLAGKLRWTAEYAETIAQYDAAGRLLHLLLLYNEQFGQELEPGRRYELDLGLRQGSLATLVGISRESINKILQEWRQRALIDFNPHSRKLTILDLAQVIAERDSRRGGSGVD